MMLVWKRAALVAALGILSPAPASGAPPHAVAPKLVVHHPNRVYFPAAYSDRKTYAKVATVTSRKYFDATPEYKQIAKRKLSPTTAEWTLLVKAASDKFRAAVSKVASDGGYDLVAETGAISWDDRRAVGDATSGIMTQLPDGGR